MSRLASWFRQWARHCVRVASSASVASTEVLLSKGHSALGPAVRQRRAREARRTRSRRRSTAKMRAMPKGMSSGTGETAATIWRRSFSGMLPPWTRRERRS
ncbi:hypothetical protein AQI88_38560 [Streptomyces cellostaticus]|uniref:Uncharacterized protein n=1 Tax=Streptomyces cellostaticus TaxID=67285 RepID=A0A101NDD6_9ACTN|nr:hypothetical protein AQI88_38560 [Streptomyces cellostaticus]